jgi:hypothetical protein
MSHIFLSYAHADRTDAEHLYEQLTAESFPVWLDHKVLLVGQKWEDEIDTAIRDASAFIALISKNSVDHRGYVQKELRLALDVLSQTPSNQIYVLPVRLQDVRPVDKQLRALHWLDLFPNWDTSLAKLIEALKTIPNLRTALKEERSLGESEKSPRIFRSMADVFRAVLEKIPQSTPGSGATNAFHLTFRTNEDGVDLPETLVAKYPKEMKIILEHQYADLMCDEEFFAVTLSFSGEEARIKVPYKAIVELTEPSKHIRVA